ncbi:hypothetical protein FHS89_002812 [Rubricella aquisinus]|uniref:Uncharacterized protein n=1 Tax=Rubricella aquisinus TaxID=2028108 RepID=A0A840X041_9RHOB|nr:hypothetical protein [Rubricella aquisinus]
MTGPKNKTSVRPGRAGRALAGFAARTKHSSFG